MFKYPIETFMIYEIIFIKYVNFINFIFHRFNFSIVLTSVKVIKDISIILAALSFIGWLDIAIISIKQRIFLIERRYQFIVLDAWLTM